MAMNREQLEDHLRDKKIASVCISLESQLRDRPPDGKTCHTPNCQVYFSGVIHTAMRHPDNDSCKGTFGDAKRRESEHYSKHLKFIHEAVNEYGCKV